MNNILNFLIQANKLKKMPRTGFVWLGIKNPETIAQHAFRVAIMNWILGEKIRPKLNLEKVIKISLVHDLCEVYAGDMTPYWGLLPEDPKKRREILKRWIRLPKRIKEKREEKKFKKEKKSLEGLLKNLQPKLKREVMSRWLEYEKLGSPEGRFVKQGDKIETLLQAIEYWGPDLTSPVFGWWEEVEDLVDNPTLLDFLGKIERKFYEKKKINGELDFFLKVGKLKTMPRTGLVLRGVKDPATVAEDAFLLTLAIWALNENRKLNLEKMLKMALVYEVCEVYAEDQTPYEGILPKDIKKRRKILERWPRFSRKEKEKRFLKDYKREKKALEKLTFGLSPHLKREIINLWDDCTRRLTPEGNFVNQVYWVAMMMQVLQYWKEDKNFPIFGWWEQMMEFIDEPLSLEFMVELRKKFV